MATKPIPIFAAKKIADEYGYNQVVIIARAVGKEGCEHVTSYGTTTSHYFVAAKMANFIKHRIMMWPETKESSNGNF